MRHRILVIMVLGLVAHVSCAKKRLFFGDYSSSESSESSNSTESDDWLGPLFSIFGPIQTTTKRPAAAGTKIPITTTTLRPPIIKCSDKPTESCPTDCLTDSAIIHGFCCNCKNPSDLKMKPAYLCPASTACPSDTTKLCDLFSRLMTCCCHDAFTPKPPTKPPSEPVGSPPGRPSPTPPMTGRPTTQKPASTEAWPTPPPRPSQTTQKPSSTDPWPTPPTRPSPTSATTPLTTSATTPLPSSATTPLPTPATTSSPSSQPPEASPIPTPPTTSAPTSPKPSDESSTPSSSTSVTSTSVPPAPLSTTAGPPQSPSGDSPSSGKSQQHHIVVDIDSGSVHDEEIDLPFETVARRAPRKRRHISGF